MRIVDADPPWRRLCVSFINRTLSWITNGASMATSFSRWRSHHIRLGEIAGRGRAIYLGIALLRLDADPDPLSITICNTARLLTAGIIRQEVIKLERNDSDACAATLKANARTIVSLENETLIKPACRLKTRIRKSDWRIYEHDVRARARDVCVCVCMCNRKGSESGGDKDSHLLPRHGQLRWWIRLITFHGSALSLSRLFARPFSFSRALLTWDCFAGLLMQTACTISW